MPKNALATLPAGPVTPDFGEFEEWAARAIAEQIAVEVRLLGLDKAPPVMDVHLCASCRAQALTPTGQTPEGWSAPHGLDGPLFCPDCARGHVPSEICPSQITPEIRSTWEGAHA